MNDSNLYILLLFFLFSGCSTVQDPTQSSTVKPRQPTSQSYQYTNYYDKDQNRTGYSKTDNKSGITYFYDKDFNYTGMSKESK